VSGGLAIVATHPVQYYAPLYRAVAGMPGMELKVFYRSLPSAIEQGGEFGRPFQWDIDLLSGYAHGHGPSAMDELFQGISERRWAAVLVHGWNDALYRRVIAKAWSRGVPILVRGDSHLHTPQAFWKRILKQPLLRWLLPRFAACLAVGRWSEEYYRYYGVMEDRIVRSPHCVDNERFAQTAALLRNQRSAIRREWGFSDDDCVFLFAGKMIPVKRVSDLIVALGTCRPTHRAVAGLLVGDGRLRRDLELQAGAAGAKVRFAGFLNQSEISKAYVAADCLWLGSESETWGLVANEALASGLPCLLSDRVGCAVDLVVPQVNGMIYRCGDVSALEECLRMIADGIVRFDPASPAWRQAVETHSCGAAAGGIARALERIPSHDFQ
jgi:glycosyltransferase involved in cell wall biosynthesis